MYFQIFQPWNQPSPTEPQKSGGGKNALDILLTTLLVGILAATILLAWRNLKMNRGDRRGALRISFYFFIFINVPEALPVPLDQSLWYSTASIRVLCFLTAIAFYGFRTALAGKPAFSFELLKE